MNHSKSTLLVVVVAASLLIVLISTVVWFGYNRKEVATSTVIQPSAEVVQTTDVPSPLPPRAQAQEYLKQQNVTEAIKLYEQMINDSPQSVEVYGNLAVAYMLDQQWEKAIEPLEYALKLNPEYFPAHYNLGLSWCHLGKNQAALKEYQAVYNLDKVQAAALLESMKQHCPLGVPQPLS